VKVDSRRRERQQAAKAEKEGSEAQTMAETLAMKTSLPRRTMPGTFEAVRAEALFLSTLQPSGPASTDQVRVAVTTTLRRLGVRDCAALVAGEFGEHPDTAVARMSWALATIRTVFPAPSMAFASRLSALAFAS
jgi:hypothetical protein